MNVTEVALHLQRTMGLDPASIGISAVERSIFARMRERQITSPDAYLKVLLASPEEWRELVESTVIPETWFFREPAAFAVLAKWVAEEWPARGSGAKFRAMSVPCSTGEEPYAIAMCLMKSGLAEDRIQVDAVDISQRSLALAREGRYGKGSFRGGIVDEHMEFFEEDASGRRVVERIKRLLRFRCANLVVERDFAGAEEYDVIFCRNLLIYFDGPTKHAAVTALRRLLKPAGLLFVGPAESPAALEAGFRSVGVPFSFAFRRVTERAEPSAPRPAKEVSWKPIAVPAKPPEPVKAASVPVVLTRGGLPPSTPPSTPAATTVPDAAATTANGTKALKDRLAAAKALADQGRLGEASEICMACVRAHPSVAEGYYLLGLVRDVQGNFAEAETHYGRALYLEPDHAEALAHLAFIKAKRGDTAGAEALQRRLRRALGKGAS